MYRDTGNTPLYVLIVRSTQLLRTLDDLFGGTVAFSDSKCLERRKDAGYPKSKAKKGIKRQVFVFYTNCWVVQYAKQGRWQQIVR